MTGHNVWNFDMRYLFIRSKLVLKQSLPNMGRTRGVTHTELTSTAHAPIYSQTVCNSRFIEIDLEQDPDRDVVHADSVGDESRRSSAASKVGCRKLSVVDGVLTLQEVHDAKVRKQQHSSGPSSSSTSRCGTGNGPDREASCRNHKKSFVYSETRSTL